MMSIYHENNEQQQLREGFVTSCYKIVSPILLQKLINDFAVCKHYSGTLYFLKMSATFVFETRTTYFKKETHYLIDQLTIPHINSETNDQSPSLTPPPPLLLFQYAATLSRRKGPDLFLQSGPFQNFLKFFQELTWSQ